MSLTPRTSLPRGRPSVVVPLPMRIYVFHSHFLLIIAVAIPNVTIASYFPSWLPATQMNRTTQAGTSLIFDADHDHARMVNCQSQL